MVSYIPEESSYIPEETPYVPEETSYVSEETPYVPEETPESGDPAGGTVIGSVAEAANHANYISGALIEIYDSATTQLIQTTYSDEAGNYQLSLLPGNYVLQVLVNGYIPVIDNIAVADGVLYLEPHLMVLGAAGTIETGRISGYITNAVNGLGTVGISLTARRGWNCTSGDIAGSAVTDGNGYYEMELPLGYYTILMEGVGCVSNYFNVAVTPGIQENTNATINPTNESQFPSGEMRVVLTWGETPRDLDSHLVGPTMDGIGSFHIYFSDKNYYENGSISAFLDVDDTTSYGPETVTVYQMSNSGTYSYYVHDYTNGYNSGSYELANSGAQVSVYFGDTLYANYHVPANIPGTVWHVFDLDATTRTITPVNAFEERISYGYANKGITGGANEIENEDTIELLSVEENIVEGDRESMLLTEISDTAELSEIQEEISMEGQTDVTETPEIMEQAETINESLCIDGETNICMPISYGGEEGSEESQESSVVVDVGMLIEGKIEDDRLQE